MNRCSCPVNSDVLKATNEIWNLLALNSPWSVGLTSYLIRQKVFSTFEEWRSYYYLSGEERYELLALLPDEIWSTLIYRSEYCAKLLHGKMLAYDKLNKYYGRTPSELLFKAGLLRKAVEVHSDILLSEIEAFQLLEYRILGETWNGLYLRESNVVKKLASTFHSLEILSVSADMDYRYGIDYILQKDSKMLCAIQIKPLSYRSSAQYVQKAQLANKNKNQKFTKKYNCPIFTLLTTEKGEIDDDTEYKSLKEYLG